ncbi:AraC family transcriptional regulator [Streptomyces sp. NPDC026672]|uniref:helix-turn-helix transcriptional regulator n=1 Tax=unclassified Streptomyces TaxID=2593676 RepID=UPI0033DE68AB
MGMYTVETHVMSEEGAAPSWSALTSSIHCAMGLGFADPEGFRGRLERQVTGAYQVVQWWSGEVEFHRSARHIARDERGTVELFVPVSGQAIVDGSSRLALRPRDMALYPIDHPLRLWHGPDFSATTLVIPTQRAENRGADLSKVRLHDGGQGIGRIVRDMVEGLRAEQRTLTAIAFDAVCDRVVDLLCLLRTDASEPGLDATYRGSVEASIRQYVRGNADDEDLSGRRLADALGWSLRYVQAVLQAAGTTPTALIREERLALARRRLENPVYRSWPIERIAHSCGFRSASAFTNTFRKEYGMTPREIRASL